MPRDFPQTVSARNDSNGVLKPRGKPKIPPRQPGVPSYGRHTINGHAYGVVYLNGREHYLGAYGSPESILRYNELVGRWLAAGRTLPEEQAATALSVNEVLLRYVEHCQRRYAARRQVASILSRTKVALRAVRELYGTTSAAAFGPKALGVVRQSWITSGRARRTINEFVATAKACFKWAASEELVPGPVWHALSAVGGLRRGDANVPEPKKVKPVPDAYVDAVLPYLPKVVRAMVEVQRLTGMRSGEVCIMRTRDIDMTGKLWVYRPQYHKSDLHGHEREVYIGERGQEVLRSWLRTELDGYLFQPREAMVAIRAERHARRVTPLRYGNVPGKKRRGTKRLPRDHYDTGSYRCAIAHACDKADAAERAKLPPGEHGDERLIPQWTPHQLRHTYATRVRREYGIEAARVMLGHQHVGVTEIYAERDHAVAATVAAKIG